MSRKNATSLVEPLISEDRDTMLNRLKQNVEDFIKKNLGAPPSGSLLLPKKPSSELAWGLLQIGLKEGKMREWSKALYGDEKFLAALVEESVRRLVQGIFEGIQRRLESEKKAFQEDWSIAVTRATGLSSQEVQAWEEALAKGQGTYQRANFPFRTAGPPKTK